MKKVLIFSLLTIILLFSALIIIPIAFKGKILKLATEEMNNNLNASVQFDDLNLSLIKSFPNLNIEFEDLSITGNQSFEGDTLVQISSTNFVVNVMSVISGDNIDIKKIKLHRPRIFLTVNDSGDANWNITKETVDQVDSDQSESTPSTPLNLNLEYYEITEGYLVYEDRASDMFVRLNKLDHNGSGNFTEEIFTLNTSTTVETFLFKMSGVSYLNDVTYSSKVNLLVDLNKSIYTFSENEFGINELIFKIDGTVEMPMDDILLDLEFKVLNNEFKNFMSLIPGVYRNDFDKVKSSGMLELGGTIAGTYNETTLPAYNVDLKVREGSFSYPDLPEKLSEVSIDLNVANPDGVADNTVLRMSSFHMKFGEIPFDAAMLVRTPESDPYIDGFVKGKVDLGKIQNMIPLEENETISGIIESDLIMKGKISALENEDYDSFHAEGFIKALDLKYITPSVSLPIEIPSLELVFNPRNLTVNNFQLNLGRTSVKMNGYVDNLLTYIFNENELLKATLDVDADIIDLNELYTENESTEVSSATDTSVAEVMQVPEFIDFMMTMKANTIYYDNLTISNLSGNLAIRDRTLGLNNVKFETLDGSITMNGVYQTKNPEIPEFFFSYDVKKIDIVKTYESFESLAALSPIAKNCKGKVSTKLNTKGILDSNMEPVLNSLTGDGILNTHNVTIENFKPLVKASEVLKMEQLKIAEVSDVTVEFAFTDGMVNISPFDVTVEGIKSNIRGSHGFDQSINYTMRMEVPTKMLGNSAAGLMNDLLDKANSSGANLSMGDVIPVTLKFTGTVDNPKIGTDFKESSSNAIKNLEDQAKAELEKQKKALEDKIRQESEKLKKEAEDRLKQETEKLKKEAQERAKKEADKLKKEAEKKILKEAEDKLKNLFGKPK